MTGRRPLKVNRGGVEYRPGMFFLGRSLSRRESSAHLNVQRRPQHAAASAVVSEHRTRCWTARRSCRCETEPRPASMASASALLAACNTPGAGCSTLPAIAGCSMTSMSSPLVCQVASQRRLLRRFAELMPQECPRPMEAASCRARWMPRAIAACIGVTIQISSGTRSPGGQRTWPEVKRPTGLSRHTTTMSPSISWISPV